MVFTDDHKQNDLRDIGRDIKVRLDPDRDGSTGDDISATPNGFTLMNKFAFSARNQALNPSPSQQQEQDKQRRETQAQRELANLAAWGAQMVTIGGVQMTNAEAQAARRNVQNNSAHYAQWAIEKGYLQPGQHDEFEQALRRMIELEEKRGRGIITAAEAEELERIRESEAGEAIDQATAQLFQARGASPTLSSDNKTQDAALSKDQAPINLESAFVTVLEAETPLEQKDQAASVSPAPKVAASGLGI